ncbi:acyl-CoA Delta-9 desaturase-like [Cylas formicarius]|uniref:acyl-CoA Delta-9 desaturase-like n=1 Tax=Cylas formicarius TaxID=197179 RepID=UPI002958C466|nr:acyl-CoA Delta-9 desaturase-like [Cylas formicarius]
MAPPALGSVPMFLAEAKIIRKGDDAPKVQAVQDDTQRRTTKSVPKSEKYRWKIVWKNVFIFIMLHSFMLYGMYLLSKVSWTTIIFTYLYTMFAGFGITAGAHRLWAHRTYKANFPLRLFLMLAQSAALQNDIHEWVRDHRVHHKFTDTDADPHNAKRGFFFSHIGWLMVKKHRDVIEKGKTVDMSDVIADPLVRFQIKYYVPLIITLCFLLPSVVPWYFWGEDGWRSFVVCVMRYTVSLNGTWLVNSAAHIYGMKPYDKSIKPTENRFVSFMAFGEGWHNYHHVFPWDYKAAELGNYRLNFTTAFLDLMARIGWATELKTASEEIVKKRVLRTGDGTYPNIESMVAQMAGQDHHHDDGELIWGWGDKDMKEEEKNDIKFYNGIRT